MTDLLALEFVQTALLASVIIGLLLSYLGVHVVGRGIVFVDLALGQISMLGVAFAVYFELDATVISILFTLAGAFLLSFINVRDPRLKQEAIIGIIYAVSSAVTVLFISKAAHSDSDISEVLFGSLFTVTQSQIVVIAAVFAALGLLHLLFRRRFFEITEKFARGETSDLGTFNIWNFLFYISIGLAIVVAVRVGGVIPVFAYLVVPPVSAILLVHGRGRLVALTLLISVLGSLMGILFSVGYDFPAGSSIVAMLGALFAFAALVRLVKGQSTKAGG